MSDNLEHIVPINEIRNRWHSAAPAKRYRVHLTLIDVSDGTPRAVVRTLIAVSRLSREKAIALALESCYGITRPSFNRAAGSKVVWDIEVDDLGVVDATNPTDEDTWLTRAKNTDSRSSAIDALLVTGACKSD